jgi:bifunctional DNase/RNase
MSVAHLGVDRSTNSPVVVRREVGGERTLPIWIGTNEANAIAMELQGVKPERPMTHDCCAISSPLAASLAGYRSPIR